ncbi:hypothetical protein ACSBOB_28250 [Mesorhizobium sp. ASY16-5R]|uniref:hypothetical protein n=1 Tax=Mesorhizobium sp. ASY16-5R TaxID=3445772 RepID=UPI003FA14028
MSDSSAPTAGIAPPQLTANAVDLDSVERQMLQRDGVDLTEAKEAIVDALLGLTVARCTGESAEGDIIYGTRPSARLVSGFLLPRFDETGLEDETSDIHLATMGIDLQVGAGQRAEVVVRPRASVYLRVLPTWDDVVDPRHDMMPQVQLSRQTRQEVERRARDYINAGIATLAPIADDEPDERPGDAVAAAEQAHDVADAATEAAAERPDDPEARGLVRATAQAATRAEEIVQTRHAALDRRSAAQRGRIAAVAAIRRAAFDQAFADLGINLIPVGDEGQSSRPVGAADLAGCGRRGGAGWG